MSTRRFKEELAELEAANLKRSLRTFDPLIGSEVQYEGESFINLSSNDYLGLSQHPKVKQAGIEAIQQFGAGSTASRLVCGTSSLNVELEQLLAQSKKAKAALVFANGFATAYGTITALFGKEDVILLDKLSHACLIDGARASGAKIRVFPHNNLDRLESLLKSESEKLSPNGKILIVTESVFSMDGDLCPLKEIVELKNQFGAMLLLDEAHGFGVLGQTGMGLAEELNLQEEVELQMGTLGKAAGSAGGYLAASQCTIDLLVNKARSFIYSTAPPPAQIASALAAVEIIKSAEGTQLRAQLKKNITHFQEALSPLFFNTQTSNTAIQPIVVGDNEKALTLSKRFLEAGFIVPAIRYPTVPRNTARLRVTLNSGIEPKSLNAGLQIFCSELKAIEL